MRIGASELGLSWSRQTKLTRYHLLQLECSSRALPFCLSLTTWQVCDVRRDAGGAAEMPRGVVWQLRGECLGTPQSRAATIDSLEIPSYHIYMFNYMYKFNLKNSSSRALFNEPPKREACWGGISWEVCERLILTAGAQIWTQGLTI